MWDLWWIKWYWDRFFSEFFGLPVNIITPSFPKLIYHPEDEQYARQWQQFSDVVSPHDQSINQPTNRY
jgi:hypothetical protein